MNEIQFVLPDGIDDPARPSGGNAYDRRVCRELAARGWAVHELPVAGAWPTPDPAARRRLAAALAACPDGAVVLVDGLVGSAAPDVLRPEAGRLRLVLLVHAPLEDTREAGAVAAARAVITTSGWARDRVRDRYRLPAAAVTAAVPGADRAEAPAGTDGGGELLCVATVAPHKGHDVLVEALAELGDHGWRCVCVGGLDRDPGFVTRLRARIDRTGLRERVCLAGPLVGAAVDRAYAAADLLVLPSRGETYGMVVSEALARGRPVVATAVGGVPEALGAADDGARPGLLVPAGDAGALAAALRRWLTDADLRHELRSAAARRRAGLPQWDETARRIERVLVEVAA